PQLEKFLEKPDADEQLGVCASLAGERHYLQGKLAAFRNKSVTLHGSSSALPINEDIALLLLLQQEPLGRSTYLGGGLVQAKPDKSTVFPRVLRGALFDASGKPKPHVLVADSPAAVTDMNRKFVNLLYQILSEVDRHNVGKEWKQQVSVQAYTHTDRDNEQLTTILMECLNQPDIAAQAMALLLHFQGPDLMLSDEHPGLPVPLPVLVLQNALTKLLALPVEVSYTLPEALAALDSKFVYPRKEHVHYPLGHGLRSESIHAIWHLKQKDKLQSLRKDAEFYL